MLQVTPDLLAQGLSVSALVVRQTDNSRTPPELIAHRRKIGSTLGAFWKKRSISAHPALAEYHRLHEAVGVQNEPSAPEKLILYVRRHQDFPSAGAVVDCYNSVSVRTLLSIGAHDLDHLQAPITLRQCTAMDTFQPLGQQEQQSVEGEYAYLDPQGQVICRLEVRQCEPTKVTRTSRDIVFFLQGNRYIPASILLKGTWLLAEMVERFCGGQAELVSFHDAGLGVAPLGGDRPQVSIDDFKGLNLRIGTVEEVGATSLPGLALVTVRLNRNTQAICPTSLVSEQTVGQRVVVAVGLHPLRLGDQKITAYVLGAHEEKRALVLQITSPIEDGEALR